MAGFLSGTGTASYNGVDFPVQIKSRFQLLPVEDDAGRGMKYVRHICTISGTFHNFDANTGNNVIPGTLDNEATGWPELQRKLLEPGKTFTFTDKGFGSAFVVNSNKADVTYGPKPRMLEWSEAVGAQAVYFTWTCEFHISNCGTAHPPGRLAQFVYEMNWSIGQSGLTARTVSGLYEIPATRNGNEVTDTADRYRHKIKVVLPKGYERVQQDFTLSADKRTLRFSITDVEIPSDNPYFPGIIRPDVTYGVDNESLGMSIWLMNLSGRIEVAKGYPRWYAWVAFLLCFQARKEAIRKGRDRRGKPARFILIDHIGIQEELFGRSMSFSLSWQISCSLRDILPASGLWTITPTTSWDSYRTSMLVNGHWDTRGYAKMMHSTEEDSIVGLCEDSNIVIGKDNGPSSPSDKAHYLDDYKPDPEQSWLYFQNNVEWVRNTQTYAHQPLKRPESYSPGEMTAGTIPSSPPGSSVSPPIIHRRTQSGYYVRMKGHAIRAGFPIPNIELLSYGGAKATPVGKGRFSHRTIGQFTCPVYLASWDKVYSLDSTPNGDATVTKPDAKDFRRM